MTKLIFFIFMNIDIGRLYELYADTIRHCGTFLLKETDEIIGHSLFEEFDIGSLAFLYYENVIQLYNANMISEAELKKALQIRQMKLDLVENNEWHFDKVKTSPNWLRMLKAGDELIELNKLHQLSLRK